MNVIWGVFPEPRFLTSAAMRPADGHSCTSNSTALKPAGASGFRGASKMRLCDQSGEHGAFTRYNRTRLNRAFTHDKWTDANESMHCNPDVTRANASLLCSITKFYLHVLCNAGSEVRLTEVDHYPIDCKDYFWGFLPLVAIRRIRYEGNNNRLRNRLRGIHKIGGK